MQYSCAESSNISKFVCRIINSLHVYMYICIYSYIANIWSYYNIYPYTSCEMIKCLDHKLQDHLTPYCDRNGYSGTFQGHFSSTCYNTLLSLTHYLVLVLLSWIYSTCSFQFNMSRLVVYCQQFF